MARIYTRREVKRRKLRFQVFAGLFDFVASIAGVFVIIACVVLLSALFKWTVKDVEESFRSLWDIFTSAIIIPQ